MVFFNLGRGRRLPYKTTVNRRRGGACSSRLLRRQIPHLIQHIFNENAVARVGVIDEHVGHRTYDFSILENGEPDTSVVNKGQHFLTKSSQKVAECNQGVFLNVFFL